MPFRPKPCKKCGEEFQPRSIWEKLCFKCKPKHPLTPHYCLWCGKDLKDIEPKVSGRKFCSRKSICGLSYSIIQRRIWALDVSPEEKKRLIQQLEKEGKKFKFGGKK